MKKFISTMIVAVALMAATPALAQGFKFGVKGGLNVTSMSFDSFNNAVDMAKKNKAGWYIGPTVKFSLPIGLGFDAAAFYDQLNTQMEGNDIKQKTVYIPINLRYNIGLGGLGSVYVAAGPQFGFNVGDTDIDVMYLGESKEQIKDNFQIRKSTLGINLGAGVSLLKHLEVGLVYNIPFGNTADVKGGLKDMYEDLKYKYDVKSNTFQVSAAFYF